jgi:hypothetical protein
MYVILVIICFNVLTCAFGIPMLVDYLRHLKVRDIYISDIFIWFFILLVSPALIFSGFLAGIVYIFSKLFGWLMKNADKTIYKRKG